jgi:phage-related protein
VNNACDPVDPCAQAFGVTCAEFEWDYLKASNTDVSDSFGVSVALSGDTLAVGARYEDSAATGVNGDQSSSAAFASGAVYVFTRSGGAWSQQAYLKASNTDAGDFFGSSVALSGNTLAVGVHQEASAATGVNGDQSSNAAENSGAVYVFTRSGGAWSQQAYLKASNTDTTDLFGYSVALSGDTLAVGANAEDSDATGVNGDQSSNAAGNSGAVYVFTRSGGAWSQQAYLKASNTGNSDFFGGSVALSDNTLAVGAYGENSNATGVNGDQSSNAASDSGAVYVFTRSGGAWSQQAYLKASNTGAHDHFGASVALSDNTLAVGADWESSDAAGVNGDQSSNGASMSGAVYLFTRSGGAWSQQAYLKASNTDEHDYFGGSVALSGDTLAVGAFGEDSDATGVNGDQSPDTEHFTGAVYVFTRSGGAWSQQAYLKASNTDVTDYFGESVALSGNTLAVGAQYEQSAATGVNGDQSSNVADHAGAVYVTRAP